MLKALPVFVWQCQSRRHQWQLDTVWSRPSCLYYASSLLTFIPR